MMFKKFISVFVLYFCFAMAGHAGEKDQSEINDTSFEAEKNYFGFKYVEIKWDNNIFNLAGNTVELEKDDRNAFAVEFFVHLHGFSRAELNHILIGVQFLRQEWAVKSDSGGPSGREFTTDTATIDLFTYLVSYKFYDTGRFQSSLGVGYGSAKFKLHSGTNVILEGSTYQVNAAVEYMVTRRSGFSLTLTRTVMDASDVYQNRVKNYATSAQLAFNFHF